MTQLDNRFLLQVSALLKDMFSIDELQRWLRLHYPQVASELGGTSLAAYVQDLVELLKRKGELDEPFFARLRDSFPKRSADITRVAALLSLASGTLPELPAQASRASPLSRRFRPIWYAAAALLLVTTVAILFSRGSFNLPETKQEFWAEGPHTKLCNENEFPSVCSDGATCQTGLCVPVSAPTRCEPGSPCEETCSCEEPFSCDGEGICTLGPSAEANFDPDICGDVGAPGFLNDLKKNCPDPRSCDSKDLSKYAIADDNFLNLMVGFPNTIAIHFPDRQPSRRWPEDAQKAHYINRISMSLPALGKADRVILVGFSSQLCDHKDRVANMEITLKRLILAQDLIHSAATSALSAGKAEAIEAKISFIHLGDRSPIDARFYIERYGERPLAWDSDNEEHLLNSIKKQASGKTRRRDCLLNQVVFIVPIPACNFK